MFYFHTVSHCSWLVCSHTLCLVLILKAHRETFSANKKQKNTFKVVSLRSFLCTPFSLILPLFASTANAGIISFTVLRCVFNRAKLPSPANRTDHHISNSIVLSSWNTHTLFGYGRWVCIRAKIFFHYVYVQQLTLLPLLASIYANWAYLNLLDGYLSLFAILPSKRYDPFVVLLVRVRGEKFSARFTLLYYRNLCVAIYFVYDS